MNRTLNYMARQPKLHQHPLPFGLQYVQICPNQVCRSPVKSPDDKITIENQIVKKYCSQIACSCYSFGRASQRELRARRREE